jgi:hypothetical protein
VMGKKGLKATSRFAPLPVVPGRNMDWAWSKKNCDEKEGRLSSDEPRVHREAHGP